VLVRIRGRRYRSGWIRPPVTRVGLLTMLAIIIVFLVVIVFAILIHLL
jgi:hypothetical protein